MSNETTFTIAGIAKHNGVKTFRFSNGRINLRTNMLRHQGLVDIDLHELPRPMTKVQAMVWVMQNVKGAKGAVIATRAADKTVKNELVLEAEKKVAALAKAKATRAAKKKEAAAA